MIELPRRNLNYIRESPSKTQATHGNYGQKAILVDFVSKGTQHMGELIIYFPESVGLDKGLCLSVCADHVKVINDIQGIVKNLDKLYKSENTQFKYAAESSTVTPQVAQWFQAVDRDGSGEISWQELQSALVNAEGQNFSETACRLMIGMFDKDRTGTINVNEFQELYNYINSWLGTFRMYDKDQSGNIEETELSQALQQMGFRFSPEFVHSLVERSDLKNHRTMSIDQFIVTCVQIQRLTEAFRAKDTEMKGVITVGFEEYLGIALNCSI